MTRIGLKFAAGLFAAIVLVSTIQTDALARNLYVSPDGDGSTGQNWKKAFQSLTNIDWNKVTPNDHIVIDGGTSGITYLGDVVIPKGNLIVRQSRLPKHNGQVTISGPGLSTGQLKANGITINADNVHIIGNKRSGIKVSLFAERLVYLKGNNCSITNVEMTRVTGYPPYTQGRRACLEFSGYNNRIRNCDFRDFTRNALETVVEGKRNLTVFRNCTFGNNGYGYWGEFGMGIVGASNSNSNNSTYVLNCIFGPYNLKGIDFKEGNLIVHNSLFLGAHTANISFSPASGSSSRARLNKCTLYSANLTGFSQYGYTINQIAHSGYGDMKVRNSIVYGGVISVPAGTSLNGGGNFQYRVSGNTQTLANEIVDPKFVEDATMSANVTASTIRPRVWTTTSYALKPDSPATGKGSPIVNVTDIVPAYGPNSGFPPLGGP